MSRIETAAATRRALLDHAADLLDVGGPDAVTLREVGARAGVSRGAPYRHFVDKESLLTAVAAESWESLGDRFRTLRSDPDTSAAGTLREALGSVIALSRERPHLYRLMFSAPRADPAAVVRAAQGMCDEFVVIVEAVVGEKRAADSAGILLTGVHGAAGLEASGLLVTDKWHTNAVELTDALLAILGDGDSHS